MENTVVITARGPISSLSLGLFVRKKFPKIAYRLKKVFNKIMIFAALTDFMILTPVKCRYAKMTTVHITAKKR